MTIAFRSATSGDANSTSATLTLPAGAVQGDILIAVMAVPTGGTITPHSAWSSAEVFTGSGDGAVVTKVYVRQAGASESASWAFTCSPSSLISWAVMAFSGGAGLDPVDAAQSLAASVITGNSAFDEATLSITPSGAGRMCVSIIAYDPSYSGTLGHTWATSGGFTERVDEGESNEIQLTIATGAPVQFGSAPFAYYVMEPYSDHSTPGFEACSLIAIFLNPGTAPTVTSITPDHGPVTGGDTITIEGTAFVDGNTTVTIGGTAATSVEVLSTTLLTCVTPALTVGSKTVTVRTPDGSVDA